MFLLELITYFFGSQVEQSEWVKFAFTSVAWELVHAIDG
jgi:hypothetical protein